MFSAYITLRNSLLLACSIFVCTTLSGATIYVDAGISGGTGTSWATAYGDLQDALADAVSGDEIWVKNGTYYPTTDTVRNIYFEVPSGVKLYGGFVGTETSLTSWNPAASTTILSGDIGVSGNSIDNSYTVVYTRDVSSDTQISGLSIEDGNADKGVDALQEEKSGAGLYNSHSSSTAVSSPSLSFVTFKNNYARQQGGALYSDGNSTISIFESDFIDNVSDGSGGALYIAANGVGETADLSITESHFENNSANFGGAIYNSANGGDVTIYLESNRFTKNRAVDAGSIGGATYSFVKGSTSTSHLEIINTIFDENESFSSAGAVYSLTSDGGTGTTDIINSTFYKNHAGNSGGAVYQNESAGSDGITNVYNSIFSENTAGFNNTFNMSSFDDANDTPTILIRNSLFSEETGCGNLGIHGPNEIIDCDGSSLFSSSPAFVDKDAGNFALTTASDAINVGDNAFVPASITDDFSGNPRTVQSVVDMGALESQTVLPVELVSFSAKAAETQIVLSWITANEKDNDRFEIERSTDGRRFDYLSTTKGSGTTTLARHYQSYDKNPINGVNYYRLKQIDFDGTATFSEIVSVEIKSEKIELFPNPVAGTLYLRMSDFTVREVSFQITDLTGRTMLSGETELNDGIVTLPLSKVGSFPLGTYMVRVFSSAQMVASAKFIKID